MQSTFDMRHGVEEEKYKEKKKERNSQSIVTRRKWRRLCRVSAPKDTSSRRPRLQWAESAVLHVSSAENRHVRSVHGRLHAGSDIYLFVFLNLQFPGKLEMQPARSVSHPLYALDSHLVLRCIASSVCVRGSAQRPRYRKDCSNMVKHNLSS